MGFNLLGLSNELLAQVVSKSDVLSPVDLYHVGLTCRRIHTIALPFVYANIVQKYKAHPDHETDVIKISVVEQQMVRLLAKAIDTHPERIPWIENAQFMCYIENVEFLQEVFAIVVQLKALSTLRLVSLGAHYLPTTGGPSLYADLPFMDLPEHSPALPFLQSLTIDYPHIECQNITPLFAMKSLKHLRVVHFRYTDRGPSRGDPTTEGHGHTSNLETLEFENSYWPISWDIFRMLEGHPKLKGFLWHFEYDILLKNEVSWQLGRHITQALMPLHATITRLQLYSSYGRWGDDSSARSCEVDFSGFNVLETLEMSWRFTFARGEEETDRKQFPTRLPSSLRSLKASLSI